MESSFVELNKKLAKSLPDCMVPSVIVFIEKMPLTPNGKLDRNSLPRPVQDERNYGENYVPTCNTVESRIAAVWSEILQVERVGSSDDFFELGGDSLSAMRVVLRLSTEFGFQVSVRLLFDHPSVGALAEAIAQLGQKNSPGRQ